MALDGFTDLAPMFRCGIYALLWQGKVVYIGQSRNVFRRLRDHYLNATRNRKLYSWEPRSNKMIFDSAQVLPCMVEDLDRLEREMIRRYHPRYNVHHKPPTPAPMLAPVDLELDGVSLTLNPEPRILGLVRRA